MTASLWDLYRKFTAITTVGCYLNETPIQELKKPFYGVSPASYRSKKPAGAIMVDGRSHHASNCVIHDDRPTQAPRCARNSPTGSGQIRTDESLDSNQPRWCFAKSRGFSRLSPKRSDRIIVFRFKLCTDPNPALPRPISLQSVRQGLRNQRRPVHKKGCFSDRLLRGPSEQTAKDQEIDQKE